MFFFYTNWQDQQFIFNSFEGNGQGQRVNNLEDVLICNIHIFFHLVIFITLVLPYGPQTMNQGDYVYVNIHVHLLHIFTCTCKLYTLMEKENLYKECKLTCQGLRLNKSKVSLINVKMMTAHEKKASKCKFAVHIICMLIWYNTTNLHAWMLQIFCS